MKPHRTGTPRDLAEHEAGFSANGESQHTRRISHPQPPQPAARHALHRPANGNLAQLIHRTMTEIGRTQARLRTEQDPATRARLLRNLTIKSGFLSRLGAEQAAEQRPAGPAGWTGGRGSVRQKPDPASVGVPGTGTLTSGHLWAIARWRLKRR